MPSTTLSKVATGVAGTTGTGSLAVSIFAILRVTSARGVPSGMWVAVAGLGAAAALVISLGLTLEYRLRKLQVEVEKNAAESDTELHRTRLKIHQAVLEKASDKPESAREYQDLILASAMYLSVEQNGATLADSALAYRDVRLPDPGSSDGHVMKPSRRPRQRSIPVRSAPGGTGTETA